MAELAVETAVSLRVSARFDGLVRARVRRLPSQRVAFRRSCAIPPRHADRVLAGERGASAGLARIEPARDVSVVKLEGSHDASTIRLVDDAIAAAEAATPRRLVVDLSACLSVDSAVADALLVARDRAAADGRDLELVCEPGAHPLIRAAFAPTAPLAVDAPAGRDSQRRPDA
jgi:STAS domain